MASPLDRIDGVRQRNLATVLELVHRGNSPSRADMTALTGLNRSTIGALVSELAALGLVVETDPSAITPTPGAGSTRGEGRPTRLLADGSVSTTSRTSARCRGDRHQSRGRR
ncbi:MAG TPA: hypothetical protein PLY47_01635, partial [Rhodoglobus sp.]|nr:hypothetical protein [Rhodoglobus sp.]